MNQRPLNADELEKLSEYLWQFTMFNNSDYVVESSTRATNGSSLTQTIRMGQLVRGVAGACDTVQLMRLDAHHERHRRHADALAHERAHVPGEEHVVRRGDLRGLTAQLSRWSRVAARKLRG